MSDSLGINRDEIGYLVSSFEFEGWKLFYYEEFSSFLLENNVLKESVLSEIRPYLNFKLNKNFRVEQKIQSVPFLVSYYFDTKEIRLGTPRLSSELFILGQSEVLNLKSNRINSLRAHSEKIASLSYLHFPSLITEVTELHNLPDFTKDEFKNVTERTNEITKKLLINLNSYTPSIFEDFTDWGLGLTAQYALLRIHLLKFLAILPSLDHDKKGIEVKRILLEALSRFLKDNRRAFRANKKGQDRAMPKGISSSLKILYYISKITPPKILASVVRKSVKLMAKRFIAGETIETADKSLKSLYDTKRDVTLDQLGELVVSEREADHYCEEVLKLIKGFSLHVDRGEKNGAEINRAHVSIKVSALCSDFKPHAPDYTYELVAPRLKKILLTAKDEDVFINIDAEHYHYRDIVFKIYRRLLLETPELKNYKATGIVVQAYLRDAYKHLCEIIELAETRKITMPVRLVKGAYWDAETVEGNAHSFNAPQFLNKEETDIHFRQLIYKIYESYPHLQLCIASHNFSDHAFSEALRETHFKELPAIEHQCLHMTYEALSNALSKMGWATRNYVPVGSLLVGMAYLVRRIMENSSQVGVLTIMRSHKKGLNLSSPYDIHNKRIKENKLDLDHSITKLDDDFFNVAPLKIYLDKDREFLISAHEEFKPSLGKTISTNFKLTGELVDIFSSSDPSILVGRIPFASIDDAKLALEESDQQYLSGAWAKAPFAFRCAILVKAADLMLLSRNYLASVIVYEAGKSFTEALADVDEAIDFLNFYARTESYLQKNFLDLTSRGPTVVVAPWNFPLAIPCGMVVASLVTGNTVILKSAEQTPIIAELLTDLLYRAGVPRGVLIHLPGPGETVGDYLISDSRVSTIVFTGSKAVGTYISNKVRKRVYHNKLTGKSYRAIAVTEMGGKNAIIVTQNAELDETVSGILYSSFMHAGQKCSACSRVIVHNSLKDKLIDRLREAASDLKVGPAFNFETSVNPIISKEDFNRLCEQAVQVCDEAEKFGGKKIINRSNSINSGYCVGPVIVELPFDRAFDKDSFATKELFGPVVHIIGFSEIDDAIRLFNSTEYALTGGVFSQSQNDIDYILTKLECGNIYVNRTITGARVAIEPFGGFKLSGTGPKAGGKHYLYTLHQLNETPVELISIKVDESSKTEVHLKKPSRLNAYSRTDRMVKFLDNFSSLFESYYQGISTGHKEVLKDFSKWIAKNYVSFATKEHKNRVIPGQISFNDFSKACEHALVISTTPRPDIKTLVQIFSAILSGVGLTVFCRNKESYNFWTRIYSILLSSGFSKDNIEIFLSDSKNLEAIINHPKLSVIIFDGAITDYQSQVINFLADSKYDQRIKNILTNTDGVKSNDFYHQLLIFVWVRSFAINTMRHGAPLELDL